MNLIGILLGVAVATVVVAPLLWRTDPDEYEQRTFPSIVGYGQAEGFFG